ncbi:MAG: nucleotidyltransferase family protein [Pseudomonadota bacterium]
MSDFDEEAALRRRFVSEALQNPHNAAILERLPLLGLPDAWLVAGCLFQTVWNLHSGHAPEARIKDYDLFYFDAGDLSAAAEEAVQARAAALFADLPITVEAKNQARVHLWYEEWFGYPYIALTSAREGIGRFLVPCTCVGLQPGRLRDRTHRSEAFENRGSLGATDKPRAGPWAQEVVPDETGLPSVAADAPSAAQPPSPSGPVLHAPYGLDELYAGILRPNHACPHLPLFDAKAASYQQRWPWLQIKREFNPREQSASR